MAFKNFRLQTNNSYSGGAFDLVAANSIDVAQGTALTLTGGFAVIATPWSTIVGIARDQFVYASDNQTVAKKTVDYRPVHASDRYRIPVTGGTSLVFAGALVASNVINLSVNGVAMTPVTFATSNNNTLDLIATQLQTQFSTLIASATRSGTTTVLITPKPGVTVTLTGIVVTLGASQTTGSQVQNITATDVGQLYDITSNQTVDAVTKNASSNTLRLEDYESQSVGIFSIVNL